MARLIDADDLYDLIDGGFDIDFDETPETKRELLRMVKEAPTIDAEPVRHGKWIKDRLVSTSGGTYGIRRCSLCEAYYQDVGCRWSYCPHCGAKMDEVEG